MTPRETIYSALFTLLKSTPGIKSASRRVKHWEEVAPADQPALFMVQKSEEAMVTSPTPARWKLSVDVVLYGNNSGQDSVAPMTSLNPIIDYIMAQLLPPYVPMKQTLGGLVEWCRIEGSIVTDEGALGNQSIVVIPIAILTPQ